MMFIAISLPSLGMVNDSVKIDENDKTKEISSIEIEELMSLLNDEEIDLDDSVTYEIYDNDDELIYTKTIKKNALINDKQFVSLMGTSDFFMEIDNTLIYRTNKNYKVN